MTNSTTPRAWMTCMARRRAASSGGRVLPSRIPPAPKARTSAKREILARLGHARPQTSAAMESVI